MEGVIIAKRQIIVEIINPEALEQASINFTNTIFDIWWEKQRKVIALGKEWHVSDERTNSCK
ncbi:hypothetical protein GOM49_07335 [Clostridium bovifaecis]|uniref:Uncharacterized protein n=1 Tax=Clostridium bovifaecis TaxID=2184719 RepID=A0A6I6F0Y7_9CLOT|nr:hypothetical protein GOM49_07335 [Clostridium bovifaecis]